MKTNMYLKDGNTQQGIVAVRVLENYTNYLIYSDGRVYNMRTEKYLNENLDKTNYATVSMKNDNNNRSTKSVHKLMYEAFIGEVPNGMQINHKDENRRNNVILFDKQGNITYTNLEVVTAKENCNHGTRNQRISDATKGKKKPKYSFTVKVNNETMEEYESITSLCKAHPSQNRLTWRYRLHDKKNPQASYFCYENGNVLQITPISEQYTAKVELYNLYRNNSKKGEQN